MSMISYDDFAKLDIRIGEIKTIEVVEGADKLLRLTVDVGETHTDGSPCVRQIVSGIRTYFEDPQVLVGRKCPFLINLAPRVIRGLESQGMILAASTEEGGFALLHPHTDLLPGSKIK
jgi:methionyl-tRNA synthetase